MGRKKVTGPAPIAGDHFAEHRAGEQTGRVIEVVDVLKTCVVSRTVGRTATTMIELDSIRPHRNGWHLIKRDGRAVKWDGEKVVATS